MAPSAPQPRLTAVAHDLRSLHNVGAIFRTADGAGFDDVVLAGYTGTPPDPRIAKVALGAEQALPWCSCPTIDDLLAELAGAHVIVLEQHESSVEPATLTIPEASRRIALVACGELYGAPSELLTRADAVLELPMRGSKQSLNVSIAFGIAAYTVAGLVHPPAPRSRAGDRPVRPGVLTNGPTVGETPVRPG